MFNRKLVVAGVAALGIAAAALPTFVLPPEEPPLPTVDCKRVAAAA